MSKTDDMNRLVAADPQWDAWVELFDAYGADASELSDAAHLLRADHGIEMSDVPDVNEGQYLEGLLDYRTLRDADNNILEVHLCMAFGGPNIWWKLDGNGGCRIDAYWWGDHASAYHEHELFDRLFDFMRECVLMA